MDKIIFKMFSFEWHNTSRIDLNIQEIFLEHFKRNKQLYMSLLFVITKLNTI